MPKKTFECAELAGAILITQAKDNQKTLREQLEHRCRQQEPESLLIDDWEKFHGRLEQRTYEVFDAVPMLKKWEKEWPFVRQVIRVTRFREELKKGKGATTVHYYVSNGRLSAKEHAKYIREHWFIENKYHHVKDVAFQEDTQTKHRNPYIYATCIDMALNMLRRKGCKNIKSSIYRNSLDFDRLYENFKDVF